MNKISISEAQKATSPNSISLICAKNPFGITNLTPISWWTYLSNTPPMIGFAISKKSYTGELILNTGKAVLSIPGEAIQESAFHCGCESGRNINKSQKYNIELTGDNLKFPLHSKLAFICTLKNTTNVGDHIFYICNVEDIYYNVAEKQIYAWNGYSMLAPLK